MDNAAVTSHYNERRDEGRRGRQASPIILMRRFNNWVKSVLIALHTRPGYSVLDLCCGKGGDLGKWGNARISSYVGCDTAEVSIQQAATRYNEKSGWTFRPSYLVGDCFSAILSDYLSPQHAFDTVSCQFAMHYAFESQARVRRLLENVTERLQPGGFFIGTTPDSNVLVRKIRSVDGLEIGNDVYRVVFDENFASKRFPRDNPYGIRYSFTLGENVVDCPEFLVHFPSFERVALEYGLQLKLLCNFHDFFQEFSSDAYPQFRELMFNMRVLGDEGTIPVDQWDAIYLYTAFVFQKQGDPSLGVDAAEIRTVSGKVSQNEIVIMSSDPSQLGPGASTNAMMSNGTA